MRRCLIIILVVLLTFNIVIPSPASSQDMKIITSDKIIVKDFELTKWGKNYHKITNSAEAKRENTIKEVKGLVKRVIGEKYEKRFVFQLVDSKGEKDTFKLEAFKGKVKITGNSGVALASGLNYFLENYARTDYDYLIDDCVKMPSQFPTLDKVIVKETPYKVRYALNYCTYSYTMAFWGWEEYERFLDWCALNGINLVLDLVGQEEVVRRTLKNFGYDEKEIKEYISGPAYLAWFYMSNLTGFGGPLPASWFKERVDLAHKIHERMLGLGIKPVLQGYSGAVPRSFVTKHTDAKIISQGTWCNYDRPHILKPYVDNGRDYYDEVASLFYKEQKKVFGDITNYYSTDPFHEGGNIGDIDLKKAANTIHKKMLEQNTDSVWVIQNWQDNPKDRLLEGMVDKRKVLVLDLYSELNPNWQKRNEFNNTPWVWNMLNNFGGRMGFNGDLEVIATAVSNAKAQSKYMEGIGFTSEALGTNPLLYELLLDNIWTTEKLDYRDYVKKYAERRYSKVNIEAEKAWDILLNTVYKKKETGYYEGASESIINARPSWGLKRASVCGNFIIQYDERELEEALKHFIAAYDDLESSKGFRYDFVDVARQILSNRANVYYNNVQKAFINKDKKSFQKWSEKYLDLIKLQDRILSTNEEFLLGKWINDARNLLPEADDYTRDLFEYNARALITTWGARKQQDFNGVGLYDYSNRQWAGLTGDYYYNRWKIWLDENSKALEEGRNLKDIDWFKLEYEWVNRKGNGYAALKSEENLKNLGMMVLHSSE